MSSNDEVALVAEIIKSAAGFLGATSAGNRKAHRAALVGMAIEFGIQQGVDVAEMAAEAVKRIT